MRRFRSALLLFLVCAACDGGHEKCHADDDCPEGDVCALDGENAGSCLRYVHVERCGATFCELPQRCIQGACAVPVVADAGPMSMPDAARDTDDVPHLPTGDGGPTDGAPAGGDGAATTGDAAAAPTVTIDSPHDGDSLVDERPVLAGSIAPMAATATWQLDDAAPTPLEVSNGRFREELDVSPGEHRVTIAAVAGGQTGRAVVAFQVDYFAHVSGGQITVNDHPFRFVGLATPSLRELAWQFEQGGGPNRVDEVIHEAKALGVTVLRVPAYDDRPDSPMAMHTGPGMYNESGLAALDMVIDRAGRAGLKLVLPLVGFNEDRGGVVQYLKWGGYLAPVPGDRALFFNAGPIRELFKDHVRHLLERSNSISHRAYKDEPAILGWEVMDGVDGAGLFDPARGGQEIQDFFSDLTALIKSEAPDHLAGTGEIGYDADLQAYGPAGDQLGAAGLRGLLDGSHATAWHRTLRLPTVDFGTIQIDPAALGFPASPDVANLGAAWLRGHAAVAATEGKPLIVSVARINQTAGLDLPSRRAAMQAWLDEAASLEIAGILPGDFQPDVVMPSDDPYAWSLHDGTQPSDPTNQYADEVQAAAARLH